MARLIRRCTAVGAIALSGVLLAGCGQVALDQARVACTHIKKGLSAYDKSRASGVTVKQIEAFRAVTYDEFNAAVHIAARAAVRNGRWTALATSLNEVHRVGIDSVVPTLRAQCKVINSDQAYF